ncbi:MAG TPA: O-methyltransferase [Methylocystis sp.]|nr:O-methyltransferase [Methylocystis sp.]
MQDAWTACDDYIAQKLLRAEEAQPETLRRNAAAALPKIDVSAPQGKFLHLLTLALKARTILEIGTLGGYSTIWFARALAPGGRIVTLELEPKHAEVARANIAREGADDRVEVRVGPALKSLPRLHEEGFGPADLVFIDADKENNAHYFAWALRFARPGGVIIVDNVVREGGIVDPANQTPMVVGTRALFDAVSAEPRVAATAVQTVGAKGWDGFLLAYVK